MKLLLLGGYGVFGGRLTTLLSDVATLEIIVAGRDQRRASNFCRSFDGATDVRPLRLDRQDIATALASEAPDLVVDASGPFQDYGADRYRVIEACISAKVDYLDFADSADFVFGVSSLDAKAIEAGVFVLSGVSSFPVLTAAVLREFGKSMEIVSVDGGIAPSPHAGIGMNVMRAVVGYAGEPVKLLREGAWRNARALTESRRFTIAVPGQPPLNNIRFSLVDVPDHQVLPHEHPGMRDIWMGAGPVPEFLHRILNLLATVRAMGLAPSLSPLAGICYRVLNLLKYGEHRGGMFVRAKGRRDGKDVEQSWHLLAEGDDGPMIPSMAIEAIVRKVLAHERPKSGARPATNELELTDYEGLFSGRAIQAGIREQQRDGAPLYRELLGAALERVPQQVRNLHDSNGPRTWTGRAEVRRGHGLLAAMAAWLLGFPRASHDLPLTVSFIPEEGGERWTRDFGGTVLSSFQSKGIGRNEFLLEERFGVIKVALALVVEGNCLSFVPRRWSCLGFPLPRLLLPRGSTTETEADGKFCFDVEIFMPFIGLVAAYKGTLEPARADPRQPDG